MLIEHSIRPSSRCPIDFLFFNSHTARLYSRQSLNHGGADHRCCWSRRTGKHSESSAQSDVSRLGLDRHLHAFGRKVNRFFAKAATWRHHGQDLEQYSLSLALAGISYERWKRSVKLVDSSTDLDTTNMLVASGDEASTVVRLLQAIQSAFEDAEKTTGRYEDDISQSLNTTGDVRMDDLGARASAVNQARQSSANPWQKMRWVFHDEEKLRKLEQ